MYVTEKMRSSWCQTYTGRKFYFFSARPQDFDLEDIAASLSKQCRFNGHIRRFHSVARHSINVARCVPPRAKLWALMHDAAEEVIGDIVSPLKAQLLLVEELEENLQQLVIERFNIPYDDEIAEQVNHADRFMAFEEGAAMLRHPEVMKEWGWSPYPYTPYEPVIVRPSWAWLDQIAFRREFHRLNSEAQQFRKRYYTTVSLAA